jgi:hypothetical protein
MYAEMWYETTILPTHPLMEVCVMNQPRTAFAMECQSCVKIQSDLWQDWSRKNSVSLSTARGRNRSRTDSGRRLVSQWYHCNRNE